MKISNRGGWNKGGFLLTQEMRAETLWALSALINPPAEHETIQWKWNARRARKLLRLLDGTHRACTICKQVKPLSREHWYTQRSSQHGFQGCCKACSHENVKQSRARTMAKKRRLRAEMNL